MPVRNLAVMALFDFWSRDVICGVALVARI
jgi:hypothetical protein